MQNQTETSQAIPGKLLCADLHPDSSKGENYYKITGLNFSFSCEVAM